MNYDVVLASNSPRRRELLEGMGIKFRVEVVDGISEDYPVDLPPLEIAQYLSARKAEAYELKDNELLITADTVVIVDDEVLGKPRDSFEARDMLFRLSGRTHLVVTGVTIRTEQGSQSFSDVTEVEFDNLTHDVINYYVNTCLPLDKAGAYGIQEWIGLVGVKAIKGNYFNVMGLPTCELHRRLWQMGVSPTADE